MYPEVVVECGGVKGRGSLDWGVYIDIIYKKLFEIIYTNTVMFCRAQMMPGKGLPAGLNLRELEGLLHVIDPSTCGCAMPQQHCQIPVPQVRFSSTRSTCGCAMPQQHCQMPVPRVRFLSTRKTYSCAMPQKIPVPKVRFFID
jgi:hypothetical protein